MSNAISAFDSAVIGGTEIPASNFVPGSASFSLGGADKSLLALDGQIIHIRTAIVRNASFKALGDYSALTSPPGWTVAVSLRRNGVDIASFNALCAASYDSDSRTSSLSLKGEPQNS